jgi:peptidoglycan/xylan/chitin deacetylase (PgdA/CDA1 family)
VAKLALKIDVDTWRGTKEGVPCLLDILKSHGAHATFLFSLGPDHTGRAITRVFRRGFMKKVSRTSVRSHYGIRTLLYGTLLPGPDIGRRAAAAMRDARAAGFECGVHAWDHVRWQDKVARADGVWTEREMRRATQRFEEVFGAAPAAHGAAGWQMNVHALRLTQRLGFAYSSDTRGTCPFIPVCRAEIVMCPQIPTTLPTLDELIGLDGLTPANVAEHVLELTARPDGRDHVYTLHAELEGGKLAPVFEALLSGWRKQGHALVALREIADGLDLKRLPRHEIVMGEIPGRSGELAVQGPEFLAGQ